MIDDIRIVIDLNHEPIDAVEFLPNGERKPPRRKKIYGARDCTVRVRSIREGTQLVIEGSFAGYLQGHNVFGTMRLGTLVKAVVLKVLKELEIKPAPRESNKIKQGDVKLERLDVVGFMNCDPFGGAPFVIRALDAGLIGSNTIKFVAPSETMIYNAKSSYWSLMFYNKELQMEKKLGDAWQEFDERIRKFVEKYIRIELRLLGKELHAHGITKVQDVTRAWLRERFSQRIQELFNDLSATTISFPPVASKLDKLELQARLCALGCDVISPLPASTRRRALREIEARYGVKGTRLGAVPAFQQRTLADFRQLKWYHGAPGSFKEAGLVFGEDKVSDMVAAG